MQPTCIYMQSVAYRTAAIIFFFFLFFVVFFLKYYKTRLTNGAAVCLLISIMVLTP